MDATYARFGALEIDEQPANRRTEAPSVGTSSLRVTTPSGSRIEGAIQRDGQWFNSLGLESTEQHRHVSRVWQEKGCVPLTEFLGGVEARRGSKYDRTVAETQVRLGSDLCILDDIRLTSHALRQVGRLGEVPQGTTDFFLARAEEFAQKATLAEATAKAAQDQGDYQQARTLATRADTLRRKAAAARADLARHANDGLEEREIDWAARTRKDGSTRDARSFLVRFREQDGSQIARAILSERYGIIDNHDALRMVATCFPHESWSNGDLLASHYEDDGDNIFLNLLVADYLKNDPESRRGVGIVVRNSEVGAGSFGVMAFVFDAICLNGTIWGRRNSQIKVEQRHLGQVVLDELQEQVGEAVRHALYEGSELLSALVTARRIPLSAGDRSKLIVALSRQQGLTRTKAQAWAQGYNEMVALEQAVNKKFNPLTVGTLVDGLTRGAQKFGGEERLSMEATAGAILTPKLGADDRTLAEFWQRHRQRAAQAVNETLERQYQLVALV